MNAIKLLNPWILVLPLLMSCGEAETELTKAQTYSCAQLAREIGKREQRRDDAEIDGWINVLELAISDDREVERVASIELAANAFDEADADKSFGQLQEIHRNKGCSWQ